MLRTFHLIGPSSVDNANHTCSDGRITINVVVAPIALSTSLYMKISLRRRGDWHSTPGKDDSVPFIRLKTILHHEHTNRAAFTTSTTIFQISITKIDTLEALALELTILLSNPATFH